MNIKEYRYIQCTILILLCLSFSVIQASAGVTPKEKILSKTSDSITIVDEAGRTVTVNLPVKKIIATDTRQMETLLAIGAKDMIVGVDVSFDTHYPYLGMKDVPAVSKHATGINYEKALEQEPDLVITPVSQGESASEISKKLQGVPVVAFNLGHRDTIIPQVEIIGQILGKESEAQRLISWINKYNSIVDNRTKDLKQDEMPTYYYEATATSSKWKANVPTSRAGAVAEGCGGINIASELKYNDTTSSVVIDPEWILTKNPDYIFLDFHSQTWSGPGKTEKDFGDALSNMTEERASEGIRNVAAVKDNHVYGIDYDFVCGPRWIVGHVCFAKWLHPDIFKDLDPEAINREFLKEFLGVELEGVWAYPIPG